MVYDFIKHFGSIMVHSKKLLFGLMYWLVFFKSPFKFFNFNIQILQWSCLNLKVTLETTYDEWCYMNETHSNKKKP